MRGHARVTIPDIRIRQAAEDLLLPALRVYIRRWEEIRKATRQGSNIGEKEVHQLRVSSRRAAAALLLFRAASDSREWKRLRGVLRHGRKESGRVRDCDVHSRLLSELLPRAQQERAAAIRHVLGCISKDRDEACERLGEMAYDVRKKKWGKRYRAFLRGLAPRFAATETAMKNRFSSLAHSSLNDAAAEFHRCAQQDLGSIENVHNLRLAIKRLRYTRDLLTERLKEREEDLEGSSLQDAQVRLGEVNDIEVLIARLRSSEGDAAAEPSAASLVRELGALTDGYTAVLQLRQRRTAEWWVMEGKARVEAEISQIVQSLEMPEIKEETHEQPRASGDDVLIVDETVNGSQGFAKETHDHERNGVISAARRIAVIDIGSASIRLLVVEMTGAGSWRTLAEERAMTRLAQGLATGGTIVPDALRRSVEAVDRFVAVAKRLGADEVGAFATAAVRDAQNGAEFVAMVKDRTGLRVRMVSEEEEGMLVFRSVSRVFDLSEGASAVVDIGGGSLEVVSAISGVITDNVSMPLGAVRLTEAFGGAAESSGRRYEEMRSHIKSVLAERVRRTAQPPSVVVGCGGTFTTLLAICASARGHPVDRSMVGLAGLGPVSRQEILGLIERLRSMPLEERLRLPGLPADRADIVVAGFTSVERLLKRLGVEHVHVHPGGIRDGLVMKLVQEKETNDVVLFADFDRLRSVREFARRCCAEQPHGEQVARLALELYESMLEPGVDAHGLGTDPRERVLLEAAGVVHDVGCLVEYKSHHKHSYTMIRHADLPGWTPRLIEILALISRYHRRTEPTTRHAAFAALSGSERELVRRMAAILRVADGLDRTHGQRVLHAKVRMGTTEGVALEVVVESEEEPTVDLAAAEEKSGLFTTVFGVKLGFHWEKPVTPVVTTVARHQWRGTAMKSQPNGSASSA